MQLPKGTRRWTASLLGLVALAVLGLFASARELRPAQVSAASSDASLGRAEAGAAFVGISLAGTRYVALGDSVPYGHGLANPTNQTQRTTCAAANPHAIFGSCGSLPPNQPPSIKAYPSLVAQHFKANMSVRSTGCTLTGDQLAVSGAPASLITRPGSLDSDCPRTLMPFYSLAPQKAVDPDELAAANLATRQPSLITLQVGANDMGFVDCIAAEIGLPGATPCVDGSGNVLPAVQNRLAALQTELVSIISQLEAQAPTAKIAVLNYYQIVPTPANFSNDGSIVCLAIGARAHADPSYLANIRRDAVNLQGALNTAIAQALVTAAGPQVMGIDIAAAFDNQEMCTRNSMVFTDFIWRVAHPTEAGQARIADAVISALTSAGFH